MKLTLRKANAIQAAINEAIRALEITTEITLNEFEEVREQIDTARAKFLENDGTRKNLKVVLTEIRKKVANANSDVGINDMLANVAFLEKEINHTSGLLRQGAQTNLRVLNGKLKRNAEQTGDAAFYGRRDVSTSIFTEEEIEIFKTQVADLKKQKQKLQDELLELNVQTEIELDKTEVTVLTSVNIL